MEAHPGLDRPTGVSGSWEPETLFRLSGFDQKFSVRYTASLEERVPRIHAP